MGVLMVGAEGLVVFNEGLMIGAEPNVGIVPIEAGGGPVNLAIISFCF